MKLNNDNLPQTTVAGAFQNGKSTLINCLLDDQYAPMGKGTRTTACCSYFLFGEAEIATFVHGDTGKEEVLDRREDIFDPAFSCTGKDYLKITCWKPLLQKVILVDTPGFDANKEDDEAARNAVRKSEIVIFVHDTRQLDESARQILKTIQREGKHLLFLMNCKDDLHWHPSDEKNMHLAGVLENQLQEMGLDDSLLRINGRRVWNCNPVFAWYALGHLQRDLDHKDEGIQKDADDMIEKIHHFCKKQCKKDPTWMDKNQKDLLLSASGILDIRRCIENAAATILTNVCLNPSGEVRILTDKWASQLQAMFRQIERK